MEWQKFNTHGESQNHAFEVMCNILFEKWCKREYGEKVSYFTTINGDGGDGGVEAYCVLTSGEIIGVQKKRIENRSRKGKDMTTINLFYYLDSERKLSASLKSYMERSFNFMCSSEISRKRKDCVNRCREY